jgi:hypothetical protein
MKTFRALLLMAAVSSAAFAQGRGHDKGRGRGHDKHDRVRTTYTITDRRSDARVITRWYREHPVEYRYAPRYYVRGAVFEPGYERRIVRARPLPHALRAYVRPVPVVWVSSLPPLRSGWEYVMLDNRVYVVDRPSWNVVNFVVQLSF